MKEIFKIVEPHGEKFVIVDGMDQAIRVASPKALKIEQISDRNVYISQLPALEDVAHDATMWMQDHEPRISCSFAVLKNVYVFTLTPRRIWMEINGKRSQAIDELLDLQPEDVTEEMFYTKALKELNYLHQEVNDEDQSVVLDSPLDVDIEPLIMIVEAKRNGEPVQPNSVRTASALLDEEDGQ